jgi:hypothetical protein
MHGAVGSSELLCQLLKIDLPRVAAPSSLTKYPKRIAVVYHRTDSTIFACINLHLNGLRFRFPLKNVFIREYFAIGAVAVLAPEFEASDFATMAKYPGKAVCGEARSLFAFPAAGSHEHSVSGSLPLCFHRSCHENKMRTGSCPVKTVAGWTLKNIQAVDVVFNALPTQARIEAGVFRCCTKIDWGMSEIESYLCSRVDERRTDTASSVIGVHPKCRHPWTILRTFIHIGFDDRSCAQEKSIVMRHKSKRDAR